MVIKIHKSEKDETKFLYFLIEATTLCFVFLLIIGIPTNFYYFVLYLVNLLLDYSIVPCGFDIRPYGPIITSEKVMHLP